MFLQVPEASVEKMYHLDLGPEDVSGARTALLPGDPGRVPRIASAFGGEIQELAWKREFRTCALHVGAEAILVTSTGIGGPSTAIAVEELAKLGVRTFLRVGTTGAIQRDIAIGDVVITTGSVRLDGASSHYAPIEFPAVAHHEIVDALVRGARTEGIPSHTGVTASSDTFYPGQERSDSYSMYVLRRLQGQTEELRRLHVLNYEMESATLLTMCAALGLRAGCVSGVVDRWGEEEQITPEASALAQDNVIRVAVTAVRALALGHG
jgi:uridine phosphorylase